MRTCGNCRWCVRSFSRLRLAVYSCGAKIKFPVAWQYRAPDGIATWPERDASECSLWSSNLIREAQYCHTCGTVDCMKDGEPRCASGECGTWCSNWTPKR